MDGLRTDDRISDGKVRRVASGLAGASRLGELGLHGFQTQMRGYLRRFKGKLRKAKGTTAAA